DMRIDRHRLNDLGSLEPPMLRSTAKIPGLGDVPWGLWVGALTDAGYNGPVCVEVEDEAFHDTLEARKRSLKISHYVLQPLIA
ncbi:MAG TPA: sugar phosphate isomerase/epimerase, partial [Lacipirellulaceae bacterium]|nr:sugar phosphate isomerase/epimerase [Lacipirellulaceae bacterium]